MTKNHHDVRGEGDVTIGIGNVFADLGIDNPDEAAQKADLVMSLINQIEHLSLTNADAAVLIGLREDDLSKLLRGRTSSYSIDRIGGFVNALGVEAVPVVDATDPRKERAPVANGRGKMSPQAAVGFGNWPDEDGRQSKHFKGTDNGKRKTIRTHRDGSSS